MLKQVICYKCNQRCVVGIDEHEEEYIVSGNECDDGAEVAKDELNNSLDILTTLVRIKGANCNVVSVKSSKPIEKKLWIECSKALSRIYVGAPIKIGDVVCKNILNTGVDIVCTKNVEKSF